MQRKGDTVWILLSTINNGPMQACVYEVLENGNGHRLSTENNINPYGILELAEYIFNRIKELNSVSITLERCFNEKATGKVFPRFVISRTSEGTFRYKLYTWDGKLKEIMFITPERVIMLLNNELTRNASNRYEILNPGVIY